MTDGIGAFGTLYQVDSDPSSSFTTVAEVTSIGGPDFSADDLEMTHHLSPNRVREYIQGLLEGGEITLEVNLLPANATQSSVTDGAAGLLKSGAVRNHQIVFPDTGSTTVTFPAYFKGWNGDAPTDGKLGGSFTVKVAGDWTWS